MERPLTKNMRPDGQALTLAEYEKAGGYQSVRKALQTMTPQDVLDVIKDSKLRGRGGAGFPTGTKWSAVPMGPEARRPKYIIADADEMEPGTFKDRLLMEQTPHQLVEGLIVGAFTIEAEAAFIFLRREYTLAAQRLRRAIAEAYDTGYLGRNILGTDFSLSIHLHVSAGRYICGEGTALVNALQGGRALPSARTPLQALSGLWGRPTLMNNVETLCNVPHILVNGAEWFRSLGRGKDTGTKIFGMSGKVKKPGTWELPMGTPIRELLEERAGGMRDGLRFRGILPGGASTDFLVDRHLDLPTDYDAIQAAGSRLGTGTMIVLDDQTCPVGMVLNLVRFFAHESCGWCTPCREGLPWTAALLSDLEEGRGQPGDIEQLELQTRLLGPGRTFCALAPGAMEPLQSALKFFREDFDRHVTEHRCPWR